MSESEFKNALASNLKRLRKTKSLSLDAVASCTGVSKAILGQIERCESSPSVSVLWKISKGLEVSFTELFASENSHIYTVDRFPDDPCMKVRTLSPYSKESGLEILEMTLLEKHTQLNEGHSTGVIEYVIVLQGRIEVLFNNEWHLVKKGECIHFNADQAHGYRALTEKAIAHNIIKYPNTLWTA